jgi:hypothetical protein
VLSVLLRYTDSDCPFGIFKLFLGTVNFKHNFRACRGRMVVESSSWRDVVDTTLCDKVCQ